MKENIKHIVYLVLGWIFLILGIVGLFLPILQGILFILIGVYFLSKESKLARKLLGKIRIKYPATYGKFNEIKNKINTKMKTIFKTPK